MEVVVHSPTPSIVSTTASSKGDGKKALAAWLSWCSAKRSSPSQRSRFPITCASHILSLSQIGIARRKLATPRGADARYESISRSNLLRSRNDLAVAKERRGAVVIEGADPEYDFAHDRPAAQKRV